MSTDAAGEKRVEPLELFFDLVFVFALTQVTARMADDATWAGLGRGLLILAAVWWAWAAYAWLTNEADPARASVRLVTFAALIAMLVASLAIPGAFEDDALVFALAYLVVRVLHVALFAAASDAVSVRAAARALAPTAIGAPALLVAASAFDGAAQTAIWLLALALDYAGGALRGIDGWRLSPGHFAERHGLIVIIALGESIVAIGIGAAGLALTPALLAAASLGAVIAACLWWLYFDAALERVEQRLHALGGRARNVLARDGFSFLHLPLVAGIVLFALGMKKTLAHVEDPLGAVGAAALCGGVALYLAADAAFRARGAGERVTGRLVGAAAALALTPVAATVPALAAVALLAAGTVALVAAQAVDRRPRGAAAVA